MGLAQMLGFGLLGVKVILKRCTSSKAPLCPLPGPVLPEGFGNPSGCLQTPESCAEGDPANRALCNLDEKERGGAACK